MQRSIHDIPGEPVSRAGLKRRDFLRLGALGAAGLALGPRPLPAAPAQGGAPGKRPNVIILLTDDQGYADFSCHGNPVIKTPNMDRLHGQSVRFTDFHVAPMCTPTRGQLMTGKDCLRNGATSVCAGRSLIRPGIPTMAEIFAGNGYRTGHFGKWHLGNSYPNTPNQKGFQESVYFYGFGLTSLAEAWLNDYSDGRFRHNGVLKQYKGYCTDVWFELATQWIRERQKADEPFFVYLPTNAPHGPLWCPEKFTAPYKGKVAPQVAKFFGMIANIDDNLGQLDAMLKETGLFDNTIVILMTDNGGTAGTRFYNAGMRAGKTTYYDGGHRAACFVRWPAGGLGQPRDVDELTQNQDLLPTLIDLCGLTPPASGSFDGTSLAGLLRGQAAKLPDRMLVVQYGQVPQKWDCAVMWQKWRLVKGTELYNLKDDPGQQTDVAGRNPDVLKKMRDHYEKWWVEIEPGIKDFVPTVIGADQQNPVTLTAAEWADIYCDNLNDLRDGKRVNGPWYVKVEREGDYDIELRRWPADADAPIAGGVPAFTSRDGGTLPAGQALPVARARLKIGDKVLEPKAVTPEAKAVTFAAHIAKTPKTTIQSWFDDAQGKEICGAYYAIVRRK